MSYRIAVLGATGNVGRELLSVLSERKFPCETIHALASQRSIGREVSFGDDDTLRVESAEHFDYGSIDLCLSASGSEPLKDLVPRITASGAVVIDNSSLFRYDDDVPLVVPEVNADCVRAYKKRRIIANPNCSTIQLAVAIHPLHELARLRRAVVATYQAVSGAGKDAEDELFSQTRSIYVADPIEPKVFPKRIAFNVIPKIDAFLDDGFTREEWKMRTEIKKIVDPKIELVATCARVPVFVGHAIAANLAFEDKMTPDRARAVLKNAPGCLLVDRPEDDAFTTPAECGGEDATYVSRVRADPTLENALNLWVVADNLRKGAALNAVQIAEALINRCGDELRKR